MGKRDNFIKRAYYAIVIAASIMFFLMAVVIPSPLYSIVSVLIIIGLTYVKGRCPITWPDFSGVKVPLVLYGITFLTRAVYCFLMLPYIHQVSDFEIVLNEAQTGLFTDRFEYYRFFFHKFLYPFILNKLTIDSQTKILYFQCFLVAFVPVILYFIGKRIDNLKIGVMAAVIYIISPAQLVYVQIATEEHLAAIALLLIVFELIVLYQKIVQLESLSKGYIEVLFGAVIVGILCFLSSFTKDWASVVLVAVFICSLYLFIKSNNIQRLTIISAFVVVMLARMVCVELTLEKGEQILGVKPSNGVIAMHMYIALDPNSDGTYSLSLRDEYYQIIEDCNYNMAEANKEAFCILKERIIKDYEKMPGLLLKKGQDAYQTNSGNFVYALEKEINEDVRDKFHYLFRALSELDHLYHVFGVLCMLLAVWRNRNRYIYFTQLIILGGGLVSLLVESQNRYKYSILPLWGIPIGYAIIYLLENGNIIKNFKCSEDI